MVHCQFGQYVYYESGKSMYKFGWRRYLGFGCCNSTWHHSLLFLLLNSIVQLVFEYLSLHIFCLIRFFFFFIIILSIFLKNSLFHGQVATFLSCTKSIATRYAGGGLLDMWRIICQLYPFVNCCKSCLSWFLLDIPLIEESICYNKGYSFDWAKDYQFQVECIYNSIVTIIGKDLSKNLGSSIKEKTMLLHYMALKKLSRILISKKMYKWGSLERVVLKGH